MRTACRVSHLDASRLALARGVLCAVVVLLVATSWGRAAWAQSTAATPSAPALDEFTLAPLQRGALVQGFGADSLEPGRYALALSLHTRSGAARDTATRDTATGDTATGDAARVVESSTVELLGGFGGPSGLDVWAGISAVNATADGSQADAQPLAAPGRVRLVPRVALSAPDEQQRAALLLDLALPIRRASLATEGLHFEPRLALSGDYDWIQPTLNTGYRMHLGSDRGRELDAFTWIGGAVVPVAEQWAGVAELAGRWYLSGSELSGPARAPTEARAAARFSRARWTVELGAALGLVGGDDEPSFRMFAAVSVSPGPQPVPYDAQRPANASTSLASAEDECAAGLRGWKGGKIPTACEVTEVARATHDADCTERAAGCEPTPAPALSDCDGNEVAGGRPCREPPRTSDDPLPPLDARVYFAPNSYTVDPSHRSILDHVAALMTNAATGLRFRVVGHSDSTGPAAFNWRLSEARAILVRRLLLQRGVPWTRVTVGWYGPTVPLERSADPERNAKNRRVEFEVERVRDAEP